MSEADFRTYSDPHITYSTDKFVGVLDVTPVLLHNHGVTTSGVTVLTHAFNVKVLYGPLKMFGSSSFRLLFWDRPLWPRTTTKSKALPSPAGPFYLQWNSEMGKPEFFTTLIYMELGILKTPTKRNLQTCLERSPEASEKLLLLLCWMGT